jgi:two-component system LytT family sensor kinase
MQLRLSSLDYKQRSVITELIYLFIICVLVPFAIGHNIFDKYSLIFSLVLVNCLHIPAIVLFYRWLLPNTFGKKKYGLFFLLFPFYLVIYELNSRLASLTVMQLPFIPEKYKTGLASGHPESFDYHVFIQNFGWTGLVLLAATSLYMMRQLLKSQHNLYQAETDKLKLELTHLKSQVQPHFFFNTLNNLYSLSMSGSDKTSAMIADLSAIMRYVLYESEHEKVPLEKEVKFIKSYLQLERIRHDEPNIIEFAIQGDISSIEIEPLLFLPLIENTFKHALQKDIPGKYVKLALVVDHDELVFQTSNPWQKNSTDKSVIDDCGIGLKNVKKRLELLYPGRYQLDIEVESETFNVLLTIRLN